jgi:hypothetical protein
MLLSLALLGSAVVGRLLAGPQASAGAASGSGLSLLLLAAGTLATLWAFVSGPAHRGGEFLGERITPRGTLALGLLTAAQLLDLDTGHLRATIKEFQSSSNGSTSILTMLGLVLVALGTAAAAATLRSGNPLLATTGPLLQRLSPLAKGTLALLGLALGVVGMACLLSSDVALLLCFVLLALGATTCLFALFVAAKPGANDAPGPWGISSRGWVSLALLALAGGVLGAQEARRLGSLGSVSAAGPNKTGTSPRDPVDPVGDAPSVWSMRKYEYPTPYLSDSSSDRARLARELAETRRRLDAVEAGTRPERHAEKAAPAGKAASSGGAPSVVELSQWRHKPESPGPSSGTGPGADPDRKDKEQLEKELAALHRGIADLEAANRPFRPQENNASGKPPTVVDLSKWHH